MSPKVKSVVVILAVSFATGILSGLDSIKSHPQSFDCPSARIVLHEN